MSQPIGTYHLLRGRTSSALQNKVNLYLADGWDLYEGPIVHHYRTEERKFETFYFLGYSQAMTHKDADKPEP